MAVAMLVYENDIKSVSSTMMSPAQPLHAEKEQELIEEEPVPLQPLQPSLEVHPPLLLDVSHGQASFQCNPPDWSLPPHDEQQAEFQKGCIYALEYELQVQQADIPPPSASVPAEALLQQVATALSDNGWRSVKSVSGPVQDVVQVTGLRAGKFYAARIVATASCTHVVAKEQQLVQFAAGSSEVLPFRTLPTPPGQMQAPALAQRARTALKLKWAAPDETGGEATTQYEILVTPQPQAWDGPQADAEGWTQLYVGDERSYKLGKLGPGQRFSFRIRSSNTLGSGPWSMASTFTTQASVPGQPDLPVQVTSTEDSATIQWQAPADNGAVVSCYQLEIDDGRQGEYRLAYTGHDTHCTVQQLQSGLQYRVRVRAENSEGYSLWSHVASATTAATVPASPIGLTVIGMSRTSASLRWQPPVSDGGSPVTGYQVQLQPKTKVAAEELGSDWIIIFDGEAVATTFSALQAGCQYLVRVAARNTAGQGQFCIPLQVTTAPDVPLRPPLPEGEPAATSLLLKWVTPQHDGGASISSYKVEMRCSPAANSAAGSVSPQHILAIPENFVNIYSGPDMCVQVTDLLPGTAYEYRAAALNSQGAGPWSDVATTSTLPAAPSAPAAPAVTAATSSSLTVSWSRPYDHGSPVTSYTVNMARLGPAGSSSGSSSTTSSVHSSNQPAGNGIMENGHGEQHDDTSSSCSSQLLVDKLRWETIYTGPTMSTEVKHLKPASRYALRVRAHNAMGGSPWGESLTAMTNPAVPSQPCSLACVALSSSSVQLSWQAPTEDNGSAVTSYQLEMAVPGGAAGSWAKVWQGSGQHHQVEGLLPGRSYVWRLRAFNGCGAGPWSESVKGATLPAEPGPPAKPTFSQRTATSVKAKWSIPGDEHGSAVNRYLLQVCPADGAAAAAAADDAWQQQWQQVYEGSDLTYRVTGLQPGVTYEMRVAAANAVGIGQWSEGSSFTTLLRPPPPPTSITAEIEGGAEAVAAGDNPSPVLLVSWPAAAAAPASADAVGYEVEAAPAGSTAAALKATVAKQTNSSISGVQAGHTYAVRVRSVGAAGTGHSIWSPAVAVVVPAVPPPPASSSDGFESPVPLADVPGKRKHRKGKGSKELAVAAAAGASNSGSIDKRRVKGGIAAVAKVPKTRARTWYQKPWLFVKVVVDDALTSLFGRKGKELFYMVATTLLVIVAVVLITWFAYATNQPPPAYPGPYSM